jgi:competence protein ComGC
MAKFLDKFKCFAAFTLAETLIVMGIIGVVAALTIPNLKGESFITYTQEYDSIGVRKNFYKINRSFDVYAGTY